MRFGKYTPPVNRWARGKRMTVQKAFQHWLKPYEPSKANSLAAYKYERDLRKQSARGQHRDAVGLIRAFGASAFFRGCYINAEND